MHGSSTQHTEAPTNITICKQMTVMHMATKTSPSKEARERRTSVKYGGMRK
jgi:hypothetical protein